MVSFVAIALVAALMLVPSVSVIPSITISSRFKQSRSYEVVVPVPKADVDPKAVSAIPISVSVVISGRRDCGDTQQGDRCRSDRQAAIN
ncbi:MAG: hypothetical protein P4L46_20275 [Fimbriimonas sp.]|nr:hypothetical protein [Fimbriimonas sp.]